MELGNSGINHLIPELVVNFFVSRLASASTDPDKSGQSLQSIRQAEGYIID